MLHILFTKIVIYSEQNLRFKSRIAIDDKSVRQP